MLDDLKNACTTIEENIKKLPSGTEGKVSEMEHHVNTTQDDKNFFEQLWGGIVEFFNQALGRVRELIETARQKAQELIDFANEHILPWIFGPVYLAKSWESWQGVAEHSARVVGRMDLNQVTGAVEWEGPAASAYKETAAQQVDAGQVTTGLIQGLQDFLSSHLNGLFTMLLDIKSAFADLIASIASAATQFIGVVDPLTWSDILVKCGDVLGQTVQTLDQTQTAVIEHIRDGINSMADLKQNTISAKALPGGSGRWPQPSPNLAENPPHDGSGHGGWKH